jgi:hypothetical protein
MKEVIKKQIESELKIVENHLKIIRKILKQK